MSEDEIKCQSCKGTGVQTVKNPSEPTKRIIVRCPTCEGQGHLKKKDGK